MLEANTVNVLGVAVSPINMGLALEQISRAVANRQKGYVCVTGVIVYFMVYQIYAPKEARGGAVHCEMAIADDTR